MDCNGGTAHRFHVIANLFKYSRKFIFVGVAKYCLPQLIEQPILRIPNFNFPNRRWSKQDQAPSIARSCKYFCALYQCLSAESFALVAFGDLKISINYNCLLNIPYLRYCKYFECKEFCWLCWVYCELILNFYLVKILAVNKQKIRDS